MEILKIYKSFKKHNSIFIPKRKVVIMIEPGKFIFAEFSETTNIFSIKKYIEKFLNKKKFDLVYNNIIINNDTYLGELCYNNPNIERFFFQVIKNNDKKKRIEKYKRDINNFEEDNKHLSNELIKLRKENDNKQYINKISEEKCKNINAIYFKKMDEINELKQKLKQINDNINIMTTNDKKNKNRRQYSIESNNNFLLKNKIKVFQKSNSVFYSINGKNIFSRNKNRTKSQQNFINFEYIKNRIKIYLQL